MCYCYSRLPLNGSTNVPDGRRLLKTAILLKRAMGRCQRAGSQRPWRRRKKIRDAELCSSFSPTHLATLFSSLFHTYTHPFPPSVVNDGESYGLLCIRDRVRRPAPNVRPNITVSGMTSISSAYLPTQTSYLIYYREKYPLLENFF